VFVDSTQLIESKERPEDSTFWRVGVGQVFVPGKLRLTKSRTKAAGHPNLRNFVSSLQNYGTHEES
jgi:hypothetical protein